MGNNEIMRLVIVFTVEITQHFEDWFAVSEAIDKFDVLNDAITSFGEVCGNFLSNSFDSDGLDEYISEHQSDDATNAWSKGFVVAIKDENEEIIISRHFDYDFESRSMIGDFVIEFHENCLSDSELAKIREIPTRDTIHPT